MEDPVFRLEGVVKYRGELQDFEGPLNLILQLLSKNRVEIEDISISDILDQYLAYLDEMASMDLEIASEFVEMASHLVYIKTKVLLSGDEEISELEELKLSLEELARRDVYGRIKSVTGNMADMYRRGSGYLVKPPEYLAPVKEYQYKHEKSDLINALLSVVGKESIRPEELAILTTHIPQKFVYPTENKARELVAELKQRGVTYVQDLFTECKSRSEMVATFISLLELCKMGSVLIAGDEENLTVSYTGIGNGEITDMQEENSDGIE